ncbi:MAG: sulfur carrier protein ThiS [Sphingomonadales bacterium]|nr:sulfur carrier protein ThiS [Sphingomonadales bacterium]
MSKAISITINGDTKNVDDGMSAKALLTSLGLDPNKVALERNREIVPRSTYGDVEIVDGDQLEIVHFIGGGTE